MPETSLNALRKQVKMLEREKARREEEYRLKKKINQIQFQQTTMGKVAGGVTRFGESLTRPVQRDASGKVIAGSGGMGAKVIESLKRIGAPKPKTIQPIRMQQQQQQQQQTSALDMLSGFGTAQPMPSKKRRLKAQAQAKPFDVNDIINNLPQ